MTGSADFQPSRRHFLGSLAVLGAATTLGWPSTAHAAPPAPALPDRAHVLIRQAYVLTMDPALGEFPEADVHLREGRIVAVGKNLAAPGATVLDGRGMVVLPGLIDTHWHIWTTLLRGLAGSRPPELYFQMMSKVGPHYLPVDTYLSTRLALAEAVYGGITHVHDWSHNVRGLPYAQASLRALAESGLRGRFSLGTPAGPQAEAVDLALLRQLQADWPRYAAEDRIRLGLAWFGPGGSDPAARRRELNTARQLGLPISVHAGRKPDGSDSVTKLADVLGPDLQLVHAIDTTAAEFAQVAQARASLSISPYSELNIGYGLAPIPAMLAAGAQLGLSVDTLPLTGNADMFAIMKLTQNLANGLSRQEQRLLPRRVLALATLEGARTMGISQETGSLTPGKRADVLMVNLQAPNLGFDLDPAHLLVLAAQPTNVDTVFADGRMLKHRGQLTAINSAQLNQEATKALQQLRQRSNW